jgi:hypothetical protein
MGWITGVLSCALVALLFAFLMFSIQRVGLAALKEGLRELSVQQSRIDDTVKALQNPGEILRSLVAMFIAIILCCTAGGALGARILRKV